MSVAEEIVAPDAASPSNYARKALAASAAGYAMDGFDFLILGFMLSAISRDLGLGATAGASLATFTLIGAEQHSATAPGTTAPPRGIPRLRLVGS